MNAFQLSVILLGVNGANVTAPKSFFSPDGIDIEYSLIVILVPNCYFIRTFQNLSESLHKHSYKKLKIILRLGWVS